MIRSLRPLLLPSFIMLLAGCAALGPPSAVEKIEAAETKPRDVPEIARPSPSAPASEEQAPPPELYERMKRSAERGNFHDAVFLFALAGTYSYYDTMRVADVSLHESHGALIRQNFKSLDPDVRKKLKDEIRKALGSKDKLPAICKDVARAGPPTYLPRYMFKSGSATVKEIDTAVTWKKALDSFLHCSG